VAIAFGLLPKSVRAVAVGVKSATEVREAAESFHAALAVPLDIFRIANERIFYLHMFPCLSKK
jgi:hypothetical protein